jgi:hypothetical protein
MDEGRGLEQPRPFHEKACQPSVTALSSAYGKKTLWSSFHPRPSSPRPDDALHLWDPRLPSLVCGASLQSPRAGEGSRGQKGLSALHPLMLVAPLSTLHRDASAYTPSRPTRPASWRLQSSRPWYRAWS